MDTDEHGYETQTIKAIYAEQPEAKAVDGSRFEKMFCP
jgi:hypothetical protein